MYWAANFRRDCMLLAPSTTTAVPQSKAFPTPRAPRRTTGCAGRSPSNPPSTPVPLVAEEVVDLRVHGGIEPDIRLARRSNVRAASSEPSVRAYVSTPHGREHLTGAG